MGRFLAEVARSGDPARGEAIFRRKDMTCLKCHAIAGAGGQVGPGLESIGASAPVDYLVDSLLEPGKAVKENYHATVVATDDGRLITGIRVRQTDTELVLRDADDREVAIPAEHDRGAEARRLAHARRPHRHAHPRRAGRPGPVPLGAGQDRALRGGQGPGLPPLAGASAQPGGDHGLWSAPASTPSCRTRRHSSGIRSTPRWPASSLAAICRPITGARPLRRWRWRRRELEVSAAGKVALGLRTRSHGLTLWLDGRRIEPDRRSPNRVIADLKPGVHTLALALEPLAAPRACALHARGCSRLAGPGPGRAGQVMRHLCESLAAADEAYDGLCIC